MDANNLEYVGFWLRVGATLIDTLLFLLIQTPLLFLAYGPSNVFAGAGFRGPVDFLVNWLLPAVITVGFWAWVQATPGKMAIRARIVDASTGSEPTAAQCFIRYLGYFVAFVPMGLGVIWVAFDARKQGWHDKLAGTVVVRPKNRQPKTVVFRRSSDRG